MCAMLSSAMRAIAVVRSVCTALATAPREHAFVPHVRVQIQALPPVEPEAHEVLRLHVVAGKCQRHQERRAIEREEELAPVGMVIRVPEQDPLVVALGPGNIRLNSGVDAIVGPRREAAFQRAHHRSRDACHSCHCR